MGSIRSVQFKVVVKPRNVIARSLRVKAGQWLDVVGWQVRRYAAMIRGRGSRRLVSSALGTRYSWRFTLAQLIMREYKRRTADRAPTTR